MHPSLRRPNSPVQVLSAPTPNQRKPIIHPSPNAAKKKTQSTDKTPKQPPDPALALRRVRSPSCRALNGSDCEESWGVNGGHDLLRLHPAMVGRVERSTLRKPPG